MIFDHTDMIFDESGQFFNCTCSSYSAYSEVIKVFKEIDNVDKK